MYSENLMSKKMRTFAEKNDWLISGEYIYGDEQGYLFSGMESKGVKTFITPIPGIDENQMNELFAALDKNSATMKLQEYDITDDFLCVRVKDSMNLKPEDIEFILALLVGILQDLTIITANRCQECGKFGAENEDFVYDLYCYIHEDCKTKFDEESGSAIGPDISGANIDIETNIEPENLPEAVVELETKPISTLKKILYALGGAILGSIPWLLLPFILDLLFDLFEKVNAPELLNNFVQSLLICVCAYLISYFAIVGYRLSSAKMNIKGRWIVGIISIAVIILVQFAYLAILIFKEPAVTLNFQNFFINLVTYSFYRNMMIGAGIGIVFTLISIHPFFDSTMKTDHAKADFLKKRKLSNDENILDEDIRDDSTIASDSDAAQNIEIDTMTNTENEQ